MSDDKNPPAPKPEKQPPSPPPDRLVIRESEVPTRRK